jgi:hypothetical protein
MQSHRNEEGVPDRRDRDGQRLSRRTEDTDRPSGWPERRVEGDLQGLKDQAEA